jgi:hypothetical protein
VLLSRRRKQAVILSGLTPRTGTGAPPGAGPFREVLLARTQPDNILDAEPVSPARVAR